MVPVLPPAGAVTPFQRADAPVPSLITSSKIEVITAATGADSASSLSICPCSRMAPLRSRTSRIDQGWCRSPRFG